jgi:hypothetical protein
MKESRLRELHQQLWQINGEAFFEGEEYDIAYRALRSLRASF